MLATRHSGRACGEEGTDRVLGLWRDKRYLGTRLGIQGADGADLSSPEGLLVLSSLVKKDWRAQCTNRWSCSKRQDYSNESENEGKCKTGQGSKQPQYFRNTKTGGTYL